MKVENMALVVSGCSLYALWSVQPVLINEGRLDRQTQQTVQVEFKFDRF